MLYLDAVIRAEFDQKRWALPAKVYARPLELFESMSLSADAFAQELKLLGYRDVNCPRSRPRRPLTTISAVQAQTAAAAGNLRPAARGGESPDQTG